MKVKTHCNVYIILIAIMLFVQQIISGCSTTVTKDLQKDDLLEEGLRMEGIGLVGQNLFHDKCSLCHELPDINAYPYTPEQWVAVIDNMHDTKESRKFITVEEEEKIKIYLTRLSQAG